MKFERADLQENSRSPGDAIHKKSWGQIFHTFSWGFPRLLLWIPSFFGNPQENPCKICPLRLPSFSILHGCNFFFELFRDCGCSFQGSSEAISITGTASYFSSREQLQEIILLGNSQEFLQLQLHDLIGTFLMDCVFRQAVVVSKIQQLSRIRGHFSQPSHVLESTQTPAGTQAALKVGNGAIARLQTPDSVSFLALIEFRGESSVSSSQPMICVPKRTHWVSRRTHRVCRQTQWVSVSSRLRNSTLETVFRPFPIRWRT